jgi:hypothetical protein
VEIDHEAEIEARLKIVLARAHRPLTGDEMQLVRNQIGQDLEQRDDMRSLPLTNGDAPDGAFNPRIAQDGGMAW